MSEHDAAPDPIDRAYGQAQTRLADDGERASRRARVLAAVAADTEAVASRSRANRGWKPGAWLMVASVAGLGAFIALQVVPIATVRETRSVATPTPPSGAGVAPPPAGTAGAPPAQVAPEEVAPVLAPRSERSRAAVEAPGSPPPPPVAPPPSAPAPAAPPAPPPVAFPAQAEAPASAAVARRAAAPTPPPAVAPAPMAEASAQASSGALGARLRAAAAAGRVEELAGLLARGAPVDAADSEGETALMKSVRANRPAAAAVLRRYGANLDIRSRAGVSARQLAEEIADPTLDRALGL